MTDESPDVGDIPEGELRGRLSSHSDCEYSVGDKVWFNGNLRWEIIDVMVSVEDGEWYYHMNGLGRSNYGEQVTKSVENVDLKGEMVE